MIKYNIPVSTVSITDPIIQTLSTSFEIGSDFVSVVVVLKDSKDKIHCFQLEPMPNTDTWGDAEVMAYAQEELEKFKVLQ